MISACGLRRKALTGNVEPLQLGEQPPTGETCGRSSRGAAWRRGGLAVPVQWAFLAPSHPVDQARYCRKLSIASRGQQGVEGVSFL